MTATPVILLLGKSGLRTGLAVRDALGRGELHGLKGRVEGAEVSFADTSSHLKSLFEAGRPIIGICAAGVLIRTLAPLLGDKWREPPVLAVADDASAVVPLLGGHHGANDLARRIGAGLGIAPAVTTAGDLRFNLALDAPPRGWRLANPVDVKAFTARLLAGEAVSLKGEADWITKSGLPLADEAPLEILVTETAVEGGEGRLVYHPASLAVGVGCERNAEPAELSELVRDCLRDAGLSPLAVAGVFSVDVKADEAAVHALAEELGVPARFFTSDRLEEETPRLANPSDVVFREVGCHGVAEGAALAASGPDGELLLPKRKSRRATCAVAKALNMIDPDTTGAPRGHLAVIGMGPGQAGWRTPEADALVADATDLVGYGLYLDLLGAAADGKTRHDFPLGEEETRVRAALDLAAEGRRVALVSSGDAGIYAMATLVFELLERGGRPDWGRVEVQVTPGISALQAAASRAGAPLGHDFCTISLSDLLTPWEAIEKRIRAAAEGDFVISFYNPVSMRRTTQLARAREILLAHRPKDTPVILGRNLGRDGEKVQVVTLEELDPSMVDMLTLVMVGSSETRTVPRGQGRPWVYTPRGYAGKHK